MIREHCTISTFKEIHETLHQIYNKHRRKYRGNARDTKQMCLMWSTDSPPEVIEDTKPFEDIEKAFNVSIDDDIALDLYDMTLDQAAKKIVELQKRK